MRDMTFFEGVVQNEIVWRDRTLQIPTFFYDTTTINIAFITPVAAVQALFPSTKLKPVRLTPWHTLTLFAIFDHRDSDLGAYKEISMSFPVTIGSSTIPYFGLQRQLAKGPTVYIRHLPVETEVPCTSGVEFYNFPKFLATIDTEDDDEWLVYHVATNDKDIFTIRVRKLPVWSAGRTRFFNITMRDKRILKSEMIINMREQGFSRRADDAELILGNHPIADELRNLNLGRMISLQYLPSNQAILGPVLESYSID